VISDFQSGLDKIVFSGSLIKATGGQLHPFFFGIGTQSTRTTEYLIYDGKTLWFDADGVFKKFKPVAVVGVAGLVREDIYID